MRKSLLYEKGAYKMLVKSTPEPLWISWSRTEPQRCLYQRHCNFVKFHQHLWQIACLIPDHWEKKDAILFLCMMPSPANINYQLFMVYKYICWGCKIMWPCSKAIRLPALQQRVHQQTNKKIKHLRFWYVFVHFIHKWMYGNNITKVEKWEDIKNVFLL